jgi:hypothetical protein
MIGAVATLSCWRRTTASFRPDCVNIFRPGKHDPDAKPRTLKRSCVFSSHTKIMSALRQKQSFGLCRLCPKADIWRGVYSR